jgi:hypothetical protein
MPPTVSRRQLQAAITAALLAGGCGVDSYDTGRGPCPDQVLRVPFDSGTGAPDGGDAGAVPADGATPIEACRVHCPAQASNPNNFSSVLMSCAAVTTSAGAQMECRYQLVCPGGRAGETTADVAPADASAGALLAAMAAMEAGSVGAFDRLARELRAHGAPAALGAAARRAMGDERRHARTMGSLARRYGGRVVAPARVRSPVRDLEAVARENAVEGCVREAWGALVAAWQARRAGDPAVRSAMAVIAREEAGHAALAWGVARWAEGLLGPEARARVAAARREAAAALCEGEGVGALDDAAARALGWPRPAESRAMLAALRARVWDA